MDQPASAQNFRQLIISEQEQNRLKSRIWDDHLGARSNHDRRIQKFRRYYRMFKGLNVTRGSREGADFQVPMVRWITSGQWARMMQSCLGDDAEIIAKPTSPVDEKLATKVGTYTTWRFFEYMRAINHLSPFLFRGLLFGRSHAEILYTQDYYWERRNPNDVDFKKLAAAGLNFRKNPDGSVDVEVLAYDAPKMEALWPSELIVPAQDNVTDVTEFEWKIRRRRVTPQQLLDGEKKGHYQGVRDNWEAIAGDASQRQERDYWWDDEKIDSDEAEGVDHATLLGNRDSVEMWCWYGKWRMLKGKRDARPENIRYRDDHETELLVKYLPKTQLIVGVQDLRDLYPRMKKRDPFVTYGMAKDGSYWTSGLGELLEDLQNESTINHALFRKAGQLSVGPILFFKPSSGFDPETFEYEPGKAIPSEDPNGVKAITLQADLKYSEMMQETLKAMAELVSGVSDQTLGQAIDRPNAPRTASGQAMLLQEGNVRASLDMTMLREDLGHLIEYVYALDCEYADDQVFFRVTGDDAPFDVNNGFGAMTAEDREHPFRFDVKFATSVWSREAKKQALLQLYGLSLQNPIVQQNPRALWVLLNRIWEAFGEDGFADIIPQPPETDRPKDPKEEWQEMQDGEEVHVNPLDDDMAHIQDHRARVTREHEEPPERRDDRLIKLALAHIIEHEKQRRQKMVLQELITAATNEIQARMGGQPGQPPQPGGMPPAGGVPAAPPPGAPGPGIAPNLGVNVPAPANLPGIMAKGAPGGTQTPGE